MSGDIDHTRDARRSRLAANANPSVNLDYLVRLDGAATGAALSITVHYVPDKLVLSPDTFANYLSGLDVLSGLPLEQVAATILEDFNNEVVPRWVRIRLEQNLTGDMAHLTLLEDRQPNWRNPELLSQIERF